MDRILKRISKKIEKLPANMIDVDNDTISEKDNNKKNSFSLSVTKSVYI